MQAMTINANTNHSLVFIFQPNHNLKGLVKMKISSRGGDFVSAKGLEPLTNGLKGRCSTIELRALTGG